MIDFFRGRSEVNKELLTGAGIDKADVLFDNELTLDLGDVKARLIWFGPAHTNGDIVVFVEPDQVAITGDIAEEQVRHPADRNASHHQELACGARQDCGMQPSLILPDHSPPGDASMIPEQRAFMLDLLERAKAIKAEGKSVEEATRQITGEFAAKYPGWLRPGNMTQAVAQAYKEVP